MAQAAITLARPETTHTFTEFTGMEYLKIDIASNFGLDKETWAERILWTDTREEVLEDLVKQAEEPALYYAAVKAYREAQKGLPISYPISLDATASGLQILACLTNCAKSAAQCNVIPTGRREDAYTNLYQNMCDLIGDKTKITRADAKQAIMTSLYGSTEIPKKKFGEGALLAAFYQTMTQDIPGAWSLNLSLLGLWQPDALSHSWVLPDNYHVDVKVMVQREEIIHFLNVPYEVITYENAPSETGLSISANTVHSIDGMIVREMGRRCDYDRDHVASLLEVLTDGNWDASTERANDRMVKILWDHYQQSGFLSASILDHLDHLNMGLVDPVVIKDLILSMPEAPFKVLAVHDCFRVHPNYGNDLRRQYNQILSCLAASDLVGFIARQITKNPKVKAARLGNIAAQILQTDYALS